MARNRIGLQFDGFKEMAANYDRMGGNLKKVTEKALQESHDYITPNIHSAMSRHRDTGKTEASISDNSVVKWEGMTAGVDIGFNISNGGLPSIFLMYGTDGTPKMAKDQNLYNSIYGAKTKKEVKKLQKQIFAEEFEKLGG